MRKTKIICTLGPATDREGVLEELMRSGMDCARFNFSHGTHADQKARMDRVKELRKKMGLYTPILLDTKGPEIRLSVLPEGSRELHAGQAFTFYADGREGDEAGAGISYPHLAEALRPGDRVLVDDGRLGFTVEEIRGGDLLCRVENDWTLKSRKSLNIPNVEIPQPYLSDADRSDLLFGIEQEVDFVAASFVRRGEDVRLLRAFLDENGGKGIPIIAKIENRSGVQNADEILALADGIMVARGDMGVEIPFPELPAIQKDLIDRCYRAGKIVVTATQMLESMVHTPRPTRAEVSDIANAIYDGTTAIMLSGEVAAGDYPVESLRTMAEIAETTEKSIDYKKLYLQNDLELGEDVPNAIANSAVLAALNLEAAAIVAVTRTGATARTVAAFRPGCPVIAPCMDPRVQRRMNLIWGVYPIACREVSSPADFFDLAVEKALASGLAHKGDRIVLVASVRGLTSSDMVHVETI